MGIKYVIMLYLSGQLALGTRLNKLHTVVQDEFIIVSVDKGLNNYTDMAKLLQESYSLRLIHQVTMGSKLFMTVEGSQEDVDRIATDGDEIDVILAEPNSVLHAFPFAGERTDLRSNDAIEDASTVNVTDLPPYIPRCFKKTVGDIWGLDRVDQREPVTSSDRAYTYGEIDDGDGVNVYVVDSGVKRHTEFFGRAYWGFTTIGMDGDDDLNGHGTHVAGIIGAANYGIARSSTLIAVKVLNADGVGSTDGILVAFQWILNDYISKGRPKSIINLSLGVAGISSSLDTAVEMMIEEGIPTVVAAGNEYEDACMTSPARVPEAITVGATDITDHVASFSNWGSCVDVFAPGKDIESTYINGQYSAIVSGTSQAAPHVTGVIARYLTTSDEIPTPAQISQWIVRMSSKNRIRFRSSADATSPDRLLYMHCYTGGQWDYGAVDDSGTLLTVNVYMIVMTLTVYFSGFYHVYGAL